jgi:hypothetical protein
MASKALQIDEIVNSCCVFLYLNIDPSNCIGVERLAKQLGCVTLAREAQKVTTRIEQKKYSFLKISILKALKRTNFFVEKYNA